MSDLPAPDVRDIARLLISRLGPSVRDVSPLGAGKWSRAFSFESVDGPMVVRFGDHDEDFAKDRIAGSWQQPGLPVPTFLEMGAAFGTFYAITARADGTFLDALSRSEVPSVLPSLLRTLDTLRRVPVDDTAGFGGWDRHGVGPHSSWKGALLAVETTRPRVEGWRRRLRQWPEHERSFDCGLERLHALADQVPSRRDVIHRDWMNRNVLVTGTEITAVFDWGSSMYGDHLYDVAWLTFCASWTTGVDRLDMHRVARAHYVGEGIDADDFDRRVTCYELNIGVSALMYQAHLGDEAGVRWLATKIRASLGQDDA